MSKTIMPTIQNIPRVRYIFSKDSIRGDGPKTAGCIIHSSSVFRVAWDTMLFLLLMYICVLTPYRIGFDQHPSNFTPWWWFELYIDITFIIDVVLNFRTTYYQVDGREIYDGKSIAIHYLKTWFTIDVVSSVPFDLVFEWALGLDDTQSLGNVQATKSLKLSKSARITKLSKIARVFKLSKLVRLARASRLLTSLSILDGFYITRNQMKLLKLCLVTIIIAHVIACGWGLVAHLHDAKLYDSWLYDSGVIDSTGLEQYLTAFYWSVTTMITVGYGDVHPVNFQERMYSIFAIIIGGGYYGYIIASVASLTASWDMNKKNYYERMDAITEYMRTKNFPRGLYKKTRVYFLHYFKKKSNANEHEIIHALSNTLRKEVISFLISDIRGKMLKGVPMFAFLDSHQLAQLLRMLRPLQAEEGHSVVQAGDKEHLCEMFILMSGQLSVNNASTHDIITYLNPGACFGELTALGLKEERDVTIKATEFSELYSLTKADIIATFKDHPNVYQKMLNIAKTSSLTWDVGSSVPDDEDKHGGGTGGRPRANSFPPSDESVDGGQKVEEKEEQSGNAFDGNEENASTQELIKKMTKMMEIIKGRIDTMDQPSKQ